MSDPFPPTIDRHRGHTLLTEMLRIRRFEEKAAELYSAGKIRGFLHLYIGEEAVAVGVHEVLEPRDAVVSTYREHGHALARGLSPGSIMAEMYGVLEGCSKGHGGSMHLFSTEHRFFGGNAIVAGGLPLAVGLALADKLNERPVVSACFFGDGAVEEGEFHESLNLAALWKLPVLFLCENNQYAMGTSLVRSQSEIHMHKKAAAYGVPTAAVDGMDVLAVATATRRAVEAIRQGSGPWFLELQTYRFRAHSMFDPELYRDKEEVGQWRERCPIATFENRLMEQGLLTSADREAMESAVERELADAVAFAEAGTLEPVERLLDDVYTPTGTEAP
ncbi:MAG: pyruvate dehydrogenase (acetyl-transferring) E1 component subunit alpha [Candidatus Competibacterales bacterium]